MIRALKLLHCPTSGGGAQNDGSFFTLNTCQRSLYLGFSEDLMRQELPLAQQDVEVYSGEDAYLFLLETICGLKSQVLAEYEIVSQFKKAYAEYLKNNDRNPHLMNILEKLLGDGKKIRTQYLTQIGQQTYAGIARKLLTQTAPQGEVLILGSGQLAEDLIKLLKKRYSVQIAARNTSRVTELCSCHQIAPKAWQEDHRHYSRFPLLINTIGATDKCYDDHFFDSWAAQNPDKRVFIDLGSPSMLDTSYKPENGVIQLDYVFEHGRHLDQEKLEKVAKAKTAIQELIEKRRTSFTINFPFGWEELQFA